MPFVIKIDELIVIPKKDDTEAFTAFCNARGWQQLNNDKRAWIDEHSTFLKGYDRIAVVDDSSFLCSSKSVFRIYIQPEKYVHGASNLRNCILLNDKFVSFIPLERIAKIIDNRRYHTGWNGDRRWLFGVDTPLGELVNDWECDGCNDIHYGYSFNAEIRKLENRQYRKFTKLTDWEMWKMLNEDKRFKILAYILARFEFYVRRMLSYVHIYF